MISRKLGYSVESKPEFVLLIPNRKYKGLFGLSPYQDIKEFHIVFIMRTMVIGKRLKNSTVLLFSIKWYSIHNTFKALKKSWPPMRGILFVEVRNLNKKIFYENKKFYIELGYFSFYSKSI